ncbi:hypothetical protein [Paraliomyxa miuraensis]|uniref:hypothetical protein n=1 Tax=Paraliomyxa miuraensis TaxID=376150 RepID=UPI00224DD985|nr:hypothetical protein [Paraliomyxa miuraensis]MCX4242827.1 hypothetical protein [Paraliomyxa miuraensis]
MTTETKKASEATPADEEQSALPTILAGAGILAVAALLIFWPSGDDAKGKGSEKATAGNQAGAADGKGAGAGGRAAGVGARSVDAATSLPSTRRNSAIKLPAGGNGIAEMPEPQPQDPPPTATKDEKIAFYEKRLEQAQRVLEARQKFVDRLPQVQARVEASDKPEEGMKAFEKRKKIVEDNLAKAKQDLEEIEGKLAQLRGN